MKPKPEPKQQGVFLWDVFGPKVIAAFSGREYGNTRHAAFLKALGEDPDRLIVTQQVHGGRVIFVKVVEPALCRREADGLLAREAGLILGVRTADCLPVFFYDVEHHAIGIAHAGWRGIKKGILAGMVRLFARHLGSDPAALQAAFGPGIRACCYEVGPEFKTYFTPFYRDGKMDLIAAARAQLREEGMTEGHLHDSEICTFCDERRFFSARREKTGERTLSVLKLAL